MISTLEETNIQPKAQNRPLTVALVALYRYQNFALRLLHPLLEKIDGVKPYTIFFKHVDSNTFDPPSEKEKELFAKTIADLNPDLVGISLMSLHVPIAKDLNQIIRANSSAKIIWGGTHPTIDPEACITEADIICSGEGEGAITDLAERMRDGKGFNDIENLWVREGSNITKNPTRPLVEDLDSLPFPSYGNDSFFFINNDNLDKIDRAIEDPLLWIQGSRGCPYVCTYCINSYTRPLFKDNGKWSRMRSVGNIIEEIKEQLKIVEDSNLPKDWKQKVLFVDEVFGKSVDWMREFEKTYPKEVGMPYYMETLPLRALINPITLNLFANSGAETINFGIQTGSDYIRNHIFQRPSKNKEIIEIANEIADRGIKLKYDLIADNPYDTDEILKETIGFLFQLPKPLSFNLFRLQWFPDYPLTDRAIEDGYITKEDSSIEKLIERTTNDWAYVPNMTINDKKIILANIIWLIVWGHTSEKIARYAVFNNSIGSKLCLHALNIKAVLFGKVVGVGGLKFRYLFVTRTFKAFGYIFRGELKELVGKLIGVVKNAHYKKNHSGYHKMSS